jgi:hypothetical protein
MVQSPKELLLDFVVLLQKPTLVQEIIIEILSHSESHFLVWEINGMCPLLIYFRPETRPGGTGRNLNLSSGLCQTGSRISGPERKAAGWREPTQKSSS